MMHFDLRHQSVDQQYIAGRDVYIQQLAAPLSLTAAEYRRNRSRMLAKVRAFWITGVLEQSLHGAALIALGLREQPDVVTNPWQLVVQESNQPAHPLPAGTPMTQVYDESGGELLILGEPGAGKTTLLLQLARELLSRAEQDEILPMPVVFNISSWAVKRPPIADWLVEELNRKYQVPRKLAQAWVGTDQILPLLDGLDEVPHEHRAACIAAINTYRREHGIVPTVVCSRTSDYVALSARLELRKAIVVQPLTSQQIDIYLASAGRALEAIQGLLRADPGLQEMATSPLMLSILTLAYVGRSVEDLQTKGPLITQQQVLTDYVERMLQRRTATDRYTPEQTIYWLAELARQMRQHGQTEFYLERMQPDWLAEGRKWQHTSGAVVRLCIGLIYGVCSMLAVSATVILADYVLATFFGSSIELGNVLLAALAAGAVYGLAFGLMSRIRGDIKPAEVITWSWASIWRRLVNLDIFRSGLIGGLTMGLLTGLLWTPLWGIIFGLPFGMLAGITGWLSHEALGKQSSVMAQQAERFTWQSRVFISLIVGLIMGLILGLIAYLTFHFGLTIDLAYGGGSAVAFGLVFGLLAKRVSKLPIGTQQKHSIAIGLAFGLLSGLFSGLIFGLLVGLILSYSHGWAYGLNIGLAFGVTLGLTYGGGSAVAFGLVFGLLGKLVSKLPMGTQQKHSISTGLVFGLLSGLLSGLIFELPYWLPTKHINGSLVIESLKIGLVFGLIGIVVGGLSYELLNKRSLSIGLVIGLPNGLIFGLLIGLILGFFTGRNSGFSNGLTYGLIYGLIFGLLSWLMSSLIVESTSQGEAKIRIGWVNVWRRSINTEALRGMLILGLVSMLLNWWESWRSDGPLGGFFYGLFYGLLFGLLGGLSFGLLSGLISGLSSEMLDEHTLTAPNQGIWLSARNGVRVGLTFWLFTGLSIMLITGLLFGLVYGPIYGLTQGLMLGLIAGILCGLIAGLANGGLAGIQHLVLRVFLWHLKCAPWNYPRFLDYTAERILLRKVGGGYIFVHRLLLEYFASLNTISSPHQTVEPVQASPATTCECEYQDDRVGLKFCPHCGKPRCKF